MAGALVLLAGGISSWVGVRAAVAPAFKAVNLSSEPLYATTSGDKPVLALALSVEYPTVGAQYTPGGSSDNTYRNTNEYLGYYDAESCYTYVKAPTETPGAGQTADDYKRFTRSGAATNRTCADAFSGNFLNWATNSAIDMLRVALSGGDRYIDTASLTVLQRAVIPNGNPVCMWNSSNFPAKQLRSSGGSGYWGAVPLAMRTAAGGSDIWVANTLNRIYFKAGASSSGSCGNTSDYTLGGGVSGPAMGPIVTRSQTLPAGATYCSDENGTCNVTGVREVWYGALTSWRVAPATGAVSCSNGVFGDPLSGTVKRCYTLPYPTGAAAGWSPPASGSSQLNTDGFFYSRVEVCQKDASGNLLDVRDYGLCTKYPNGNFKPTGTIQKYAESLRLASFGYLMDPTASYNNGRYGGVLRAPIKYVGQKTFDVYGQENTPTGGNPVAEWNPTTGVFSTNPDSGSMSGTNASFGISGVVNYLNKFGRTGTPGLYKTYDPVGELYYETLRYLQGLSPSADAISNITNTMYDGFPVFTDWSNLDPYAGRDRTASYSCLKSNIVVIGDVNTHDNTGNRWPAASDANNIPNRSAWLNVVSAFESNSTSTTYVDGQGVTRNVSNPNTANGTVPHDPSIAAYAYWAHTQDIRGTKWTNGVSKQRPGLRVKTFLFDVNEYGAQNDTNTRRYNNQFFWASKYGGFESDPSNSGNEPFNTYGNPFKRQDGTNDNNVWQDSANPGEAGTYYLQSSARGVLSAFDSIFSRASTAARSIAGASVSSKSLQTATMIYQGSFDTSDWSGDLLATSVSLDGSNNVVVAATPAWSASTRLAALSAPASSRNIVLGEGTGAAFVAKNFVWGSLSSASQTALNKPTALGASDGLGQNRVAFIRGSSANEGSPFRRRNNKILGDIINSSVVFSGAPAGPYLSVGQSVFAANNQTRTKAVFVGANDGMIHAFNADNGSELFGYIPSWMIDKLSDLTSANYVQNHKSYVDGPPAVADAQIGSADEAASWKTVLVSGTGAGGRGVFALDVTDPTAFGASKVMWEFTSADDADLGFVVGQPRILKLRTNSATATPATYKWFAVFGSGVNNYQLDPQGNFSLTGAPTLFLLDLAKASNAAWQLGTNYYKVTLPVDATLAASQAPGLLNVREILNTSNVTTAIYAGDLHGKMWKLNFQPRGTSEWSMSLLSAFSSSSGPLPLYAARDSLSNVQPISMAPTIVSASRGSGAYVSFGTGKYLEVDDRSSTAQNSFYVVFDNTTNTADANPVGPALISGRGRLQSASINTTTGAITVNPFNWGRATSNGDTTQRSGWYLDYPASGERQVSAAQLIGDVLQFGSLIPGSSGGASACGATGGSGALYQVNVDTGAGTTRVSNVGVLGQPVIVEIGNVVSGSSSVGKRIRTITTSTILQGSTGASSPPGGATNVQVKQVLGRLSWRQINNYNDLKASGP